MYWQLELKHTHFPQDNIQSIYTAKSCFLSLNEFLQLEHVLSNIRNNFKRINVAFQETPELAQFGRLHLGWKKSEWEKEKSLGCFKQTIHHNWSESRPRTVKARRPGERNTTTVDRDIPRVCQHLFSSESAFYPYCVYMTLHKILKFIKK